MFDFNYIEWFKGVPPEFATMLIATIPIAELRVALPLSLIVYKLPLFSAFFWSVFGNILPVFFLVWLLGPIVNFLMKHFGFAEKFFGWWFKNVRRKFEKNSLKYGIELGLVIFVAIPLPLTGAWSGAVASFLFDIPPRRALFLIFCGVVAAGIIVTLMTQAGLFMAK
jgi:uncharacterized membrane protein